MKKVRWGIVSTADIGIKKVIPAILKSPRSEVVALASRDLGKAQAALDQLGIKDRPAHISPLLLLAANAEHDPAVPAGARLASFAHQGEALWVAGALRPDVALSRIAPAEHAVVRCLVEGRAYDEIARQRGRSVRTIAR